MNQTSNRSIDYRFVMNIERINDMCKENIISKLQKLMEDLNDLPDLDEVESVEELEKYKPFLSDLEDIQGELTDVWEEAGLIYNEKRGELL